MKIERERLEKLCLKLLTAFIEEGEVKAYDGGVCRMDQFTLLMHTHEMYQVVRHLNGVGIKVCRVDSGGQPTWRIAESV
jgi:hypothetical protein